MNTPTYAIPALLATVALVQIFLVNTTGLSPWKGGGFGMFSTIDSVTERRVVAHVRLAAGEFTADLGGPLARPRDRVQAQPTSQRGEELIQAILRHDWEPSADRRVAIATRGGERPAEVRIEVRRIRFASASDELSTSIMLASDVVRAE
jgi:hypothetical protein